MEIEGDNGQEERERWRGKSEALERLHYKAKRLKGETEVRRREDGAWGRDFLEGGRERGSDGGRDGGMEEEMEGGMEGEMEGEMEGWRKRWRDGWRERCPC